MLKVIKATSRKCKTGKLSKVVKEENDHEDLQTQILKLTRSCEISNVSDVIVAEYLLSDCLIENVNYSSRSLSALTFRCSLFLSLRRVIIDDDHYAGIKL